MSGYLLDTNVVSDLQKPRRNARVAAWTAAQPRANLFVSRIVIVEIRFGIKLLPRGSGPRLALERWREAGVRRAFRDRILDLDEAILLTWHQLVEAGRKRNRTFAEPDLMMAAIARTHGLTVATRNVRNFAACGVPVFNPWDPPP